MGKRKVTVKPATIKQLGDPRGKDATWTLVGVVPDGCCSQCAHEHEPSEPHDQTALRYQYVFYAEHNRWPTWADAMAHCTPEVRERWTASLARHGVVV